MRSLLDNKKGQLGNLQAIITTLIIIGILIGIAFLILESFKTQLRTESGTITNEIVAAVGGINSPAIVAAAPTNCFDSFVPTLVVNYSGGTIISPTNYSYSSNGTIWFIAPTNPNGFNNSNWNVTYTYAYGLEGCGGIVSTINATKTITTWLTIIVILAIVGILLAIVFSVLPSAGGSFGGFRGFGRSSGGTIAEI